MHPWKSLTDQDGFAASLFNSFLRSFREFVRVDGDRSSDRAVVEHLDQAALLAQQAELNDLVQREFRIWSGREDLGDAVQTEDRVLDAKDIVKAALRQAAVQRHQIGRASCRE